MFQCLHHVIKLCFLHVPSNWNEAVLLKVFAMRAVLYLSSPLQQAIRFACQVKDNFRVISFLYKIQKKKWKIRLIKPSKWGMKNWMIFISLGLCGLGCCSSAVCTKRASETCCINLFLLCFGLFILSFGKLRVKQRLRSCWSVVGGVFSCGSVCLCAAHLCGSCTV